MARCKFVVEVQRLLLSVPLDRNRVDGPRKPSWSLRVRRASSLAVASLTTDVDFRECRVVLIGLRIKVAFQIG